MLYNLTKRLFISQVRFSYVSFTTLTLQILRPISCCCVNRNSLSVNVLIEWKSLKKNWKQLVNDSIIFVGGGWFNTSSLNNKLKLLWTYETFIIFVIKKTLVTTVAANVMNLIKLREVNEKLYYNRWSALLI